METASKQLGNTELENKEGIRLERDVGIVQTAKIMTSWEWVWE